MCLRRYFSLMKQEQRKKQTARQLISLYQKLMEAPPGFEPGMEVLQTSALPLGDGALTTQLGEPGTKLWSGKRDSNPRLRPWQGRTLPLSYSRVPQITNAKRNIWV